MRASRYLSVIWVSSEWTSRRSKFKRERKVYDEIWEASKNISIGIFFSFCVTSKPSRCKKFEFLNFFNILVQFVKKRKEIVFREIQHKLMIIHIVTASIRTFDEIIINYTYPNELEKSFQTNYKRWIMYCALLSRMNSFDVNAFPIHHKNCETL